MSIKTKLFSFIKKLMHKQEVKESQSSVMKYVDLMEKAPGSYDNQVVIDCPYCKIARAQQLKKKDDPLAGKLKTVEQFDSSIDFVEHLVQEHYIDLTTARVLWNICYLDHSLSEAEEA